MSHTCEEDTTPAGCVSDICCRNVAKTVLCRRDIGLCSAVVRITGVTSMAAALLRVNLRSYVSTLDHPPPGSPCLLTPLGYHAAMASPAPALFAPATFTRFGDLLRYLRRRAQLTQRELSIAVGYNFAQISRLEQGQRFPDPSVIAAVFIPALNLEQEPAWAARLIELAEASRQERHDSTLMALASSQEKSAHNRAVGLDELEILEATPSPAPHEVARLRLVARLHARLVAERRVLLCGLPGMGKTTLAAALAREYATSTPVFWLTFVEGVTTSAETLVRQLAQFLLTHGQSDVQLLLRKSSQENQAVPLDHQIRFIGAALRRLVGAARGQPATPPLLCFDNLHLAQDDADLMRVLRHLSEASSARILLISREYVPALQSYAQVRLEGLELAEGLELITNLIRQHSDRPEKETAWASRLLEQTGSSPMLVQLAVTHLLDASATPDVFIDQLARQPQIASYLLETVRRQTSRTAWGLLSLVSVFRQPIDLYDPALIELIQEIDGASDLPVALDELVRRHLIDHPNRAQPHRLVRDYVYTGLITLPLHRRQLHRIAAEWSEHGLDDPVEASHHYCLSGDLAAAVATLSDNVETLTRRGRAFAAADTAAHVLTQARRQRGAPTELLCGLLVLRGDLLIHTLRAEEAEASYREALQLAEAPCARAQIAYRLARCLIQRGQAAEAVQLVEQAKAGLAPSEIAIRAQLTAAASQAHLVLTSYDAAMSAAVEALGLANQLDTDQTQTAGEIWAYTQLVLGKVMYYRRELTVALGHYRRATRAAERAGMYGFALRCELDEAAVLFDQGQYAALLDRCREFMPRLRSSDDSYGVGRLYGRIALSSLLCGDLETGLEAAEQGQAVRAMIGDIHGLVVANNHRALLLITQGRVAEARAVVERSLAENQATGEMHDLGFTLEKLAMVQMLEGDAVTAQATVRLALALPASATDAKLLSDLLHDLAVALLMSDRIDEARQIVATHSVEGGLWVELEHLLLVGLLALAGGDTPAARAAAAELAARARETGVRLYEQRSAQLAAACAAPPPYNWARLMWVTDAAARAL
jgi:ATP/maltotriose-dependent transcriptional regulator MalT